LSILDRLLVPDALSARFQPVLDAVTFSPCYVEGLISGPVGTNFERPDVLFSYVRRKHETARMDRLCAATILADARLLPSELSLAVNVEAATLTCDREFPRFLAETAEKCGIATSRLVVEIVEHTMPYDTKTFREGLRRLREMGILLALDDVGRAHSNYQMMLETCPDFFKIDHYFVSGAHADPLRMEILHSIASLAKAFGARVVAEGVEHRADLSAVRGAGIELAQGYLLLRPLSAQALIDVMRNAAFAAEESEGEAC